MSRALELAAITGVAIALWVLYLYRNRKLKEDHALLWLFVSMSIILLSLWTDLLLAINLIVGSSHPTYLVLAAFIALLIIVSVYYSVKISELTEQNRKLAQEIALLKTPQLLREKTTKNNQETGKNDHG